MKAVQRTEVNPRPTTDRAPTVWTWLQTVSQRRQRMHFSMLRTTDGERSIIGLVVSPLYLASRMPRSLAMVCRLQ